MPANAIVPCIPIEPIALAANANTPIIALNEAVTASIAPAPAQPCLAN